MRPGGLLPLAAGLLLAPALSAQGVTRCGVDRWPVKILTDRDSGRVNLTPLPTTVSALARLPKPTDDRPYSNRLPLERQAFRVRAILLEQHFSDDDSDIHLILGDPAARLVTIVAEIPDSACALGSGREVVYADARRAVARITIGTEIEVEGVAFFDKPHGQSGMAPNAIELHPVLRITPVHDSAALHSLADPQLAARRATERDSADRGAARVWLNTKSRVYHCPGATWYGRTTRGEYLSESEARRRGGRPSGGRECG